MSSHGPTRYSLRATSAAALAAMTGPFDTGDGCYVDGLTEFTFDSSSIAVVDDVNVINGPSGVGRWLRGPAPGSVGDAAAAPGSTLAAIIAGAGSYSSGLDVARPAASSATIGSCYYATDSHRLYWQATATKWVVVGVGEERALLGPFTSSAFMQADAGVFGPVGQAGMTMAVGFYVEQTGAGRRFLIGNLKGDVSTGWGITHLSNTSIECFLGGLTGVSGGTFAATVSVGAHAVALALNAAGTSLHASFDGGAVQTFAQTGTYVPPSTTERLRMSGYPGGVTDAVYEEIAWWGFWNSALADADLRTLSGSPGTYRMPSVSTGWDYAWHASWYDAGTMVHGVPNTAGSDVLMKVQGGAPMTKRVR